MSIGIKLSILLSISWDENFFNFSFFRLWGIFKLDLNPIWNLFRFSSESTLIGNWLEGVGDLRNVLANQKSSINIKTSLSNSIDLSISSKIPNQKIFSRRSAARFKTFVELSISKNSFCPRNFSNWIIVLTDFFFITWQWIVWLYPFIARVDLKFYCGLFFLSKVEILNFFTG